MIDLEKIETTHPEHVEDELITLLEKYHEIKNVSLEDIIDFHVSIPLQIIMVVSDALSCLRNA